MTEAKGDGGEGLYVRGRSGQRDMEQGTDSAWLKSQGRSSKLMCYIWQSEEHLKRGCSRGLHNNVRRVRSLDVWMLQGYNSRIEDTTMPTYLVNSIKQGMLEPVKVNCVFLRYRKGIVGNKDLDVLLRYFKVAVVDKIYAHESLTLNNTTVCDVISKWKDGLKDDIDARSDVYALSNSYRKSSADSDDYYWEYTPDMFIHLFLYIDDMVFSSGCKAEIWATKDLLDKAKGNVLGKKIVRDQSGNTLRVSQSRFYSGKLVQTLLEGHSILSLEGSLSGNYAVDKNG
nr:zinc finger, CCHC-type [Tanacetum cinerariifolium]